MSINKNTIKQGGFTIVELMIATVIFSIILLICMQTITTIGRMFYKGVTLSRTGEAARSAVDTIENDLRFADGANYSASTAMANPRWYCIGDEGYTFFPGIQVTDPSADTTTGPGGKGLVRVQYANFDACNSRAAPSGTAVQMLGSGMRLTFFEVVSSASGAGLYNVNIALANTVANDNTSLVDSTMGGSPASNYGGSVGAIHCKQGLLLDTQYCATVSLSTSVIMKGGYN